MKNLANMMKQVQQMQENLQRMQEDLANSEVTGSAGGGMVTLTMTADGAGRRASIDPSLLTTEDKDVLEDLIVAALNDARGKADSLKQEKVQELTGGLALPGGLQLPF